MTVFRLSSPRDIDAMEEITKDAILLLKRQGINQWQKGYPNREQFITDVHEQIGYVLLDGKTVCALCAVTFTEEPSYQHISNGSWLTEPTSAYATIHRMAVSPHVRGKGYASLLFSSVEELARERGMQSIRIDTHPENRAMQSALKKSGFTYCGDIILKGGAEDGDPRIAFEKLLSV